jgi:hypothetical protein
MENLENDLKEMYKKDTEEREKAVEVEEKATVDETKVETKPVEEKPKIEEKPITKVEAPKTEEKPTTTEIKKTEEVEIKPATELPRGIKTTFSEEWNKIPAEFQKEVKRSLEVKDSYIKTLEEKNNTLNKAIDIAEVEIQNVVKQTNLPREQVIGNMLSWVSDCQVDPDNTLCNALGQGAIQLKNPQGFIRFIADRYKLNLNDMVNINPSQAMLQDENARLKMRQQAQQRQVEYQNQLQEVEEGRKIESSIESFKSNHQEITSELFSSDIFQNHMSYAIEKVKSQEPNNNDLLDIMEKAYKIIEKDYNNNPQNNQTVVNNPATTANQPKKPIATITKTTGLKSSTPTSRSVQKQYTDKKEMIGDLEQELKSMYRNNNN